METFILRAHNVSKHFAHQKNLLQQLDFSVMPGQCVLIEGPNGSGKSTLLKLCGHLLPLDTGQIEVCTKNIGFVFDKLANLPQTPRQFCQSLLQLDVKNFHEHEVYFSELVKAFELVPYLDQPIRKLSKGTQQKVNLIQALMFQPELLFLDEPLEGLDPRAQTILLTHLQKLLALRSGLLLIAHHTTAFEKLHPVIFELREQKLQAVLGQNQGVTIQLTFVRPKNAPIPEEISSSSVIHCSDHQLQIQTDKGHCDQIILVLLQRKYHLEAMAYV